MMDWEQVFIDIETGPLPVEKREHTRPSREDVAYGNAKKPDTRERIYQEAIQAWEEGERAALDALTGEVIAVGYAIDDGPIEVLGNEGGEEGELSVLCGVQDIVRKAWEKKAKIVGHNLLGFDAPFLVRRAMIWDCPLLAAAVKDLRGYRPERWVDTMRVWGMGDKNHFTKLKTLCAAFGIPVKTGVVEGKDFHRFWKTDRQAALDYLIGPEGDVAATRKLARCLQI